MPLHSATLAVLFADISGSTRLYEALGNSRARQLVVRCLALMTDTLDSHRGTLIKTIGDEIMCTFPSADAAFHAACDMQDAVERGLPGGETPMYVRVGFSFGEVLREGKDVHGDVVNVAARITEVARARQILATHTAVSALSAPLRERAQHIRRASIKGRQGQLDLFQIRWRAETDAGVRIGNPADRKPEGLQEQLVLRHGDHQVTLSERNTTATLGSGASCSIVVRDDLASALHATVEYQLGKFFVSDHSANGTYVHFSGGDGVHLVGDETLLRGSGAIVLGRPLSGGTAKIIGFAVHLTPAAS